MARQMIFQRDQRMVRLAIVVPCFNEEAVLPQSVSELVRIMQELAEKRKISEYRLSGNRIDTDSA